MYYQVLLRTVELSIQGATFAAAMVERGEGDALYRRLNDTQ
jgi:hypothetical protein